MSGKVYETEKAPFQNCLFVENFVILFDLSDNRASSVCIVIFSLLVLSLFNRCQSVCMVGLSCASDNHCNGNEQIDLEYFANLENSEIEMCARHST